MSVSCFKEEKGINLQSAMQYAPSVYRGLNGIFCVYKPAGMSMKQMANVLQKKLSEDLNRMEVRPTRQMVEYSEDGGDPSSVPTVTSVPDLADHPLVAGPRYLPGDFRFGFVNRLAPQSSGVVVMGIGDGKRKLPLISSAKYVRVYHVKGELGRATEDFMDTGNILSRSAYHHVTQAKMDKIIAGMQALHQKHMFITAGVDVQSQEAYEMAVEGLVRPQGSEKLGATIYGIRCIHFQPPHFTLEIHSINETCEYLRQMIHDMGLNMKTNAVCSQVRRIRHGGFTLSHALLMKHWTGNNVMENIMYCSQLVGKGKLKHDQLIQRVEDEEDKVLLPSEQQLLLS